MNFEVLLTKQGCANWNEFWRI